MKQVEFLQRTEDDFAPEDNCSFIEVVVISQLPHVCCEDVQWQMLDNHLCSEEVRRNELDR